MQAKGEFDMKYSVSVALSGMHYCRVELPDSVEFVAIAKAREIERAFKHVLGEGVSISLTRWETVGKGVKHSGS